MAEDKSSHRMPQSNDESDRVVFGSGGGPVDPTKNVLDLVKAESKYQDAQRDSLGKLLDEKVTSLKEIVKLLGDNITTFQNTQTAAETRRIDQLAQTRQEFQNTIRDMLAESVRTTSTLVSDQLKQIQATFDTRVTKLEAGAFTEAGKKSVADPQTSDALLRITSGLSQLRMDTDANMAKVAATNAEALTKLTGAISTIGQREEHVSGAKMGQGQVIAWIIGAAMLMAAIATPLIAFISMRPH